jgi:hypothetical protein
MSKAQIGHLFWLPPAVVLGLFVIWCGIRRTDWPPNLLGLLAGIAIEIWTLRARRQRALREAHRVVRQP